MKTTSTKKKSASKTLDTEIEQKPKAIAKKNHEQLLDILQNAPAAIAVYEVPEYKYILANKAYETLTNRKEEDLLGKSFRDVFPELTGTGTFELFDHVFKTGEPFTAPEYAALVDIKNDGVLKQCYFNFSMEPLKNDSGEIYATIAMTYDITEQVEAKKIIEESEKALRTSQKALEKKEQQLQNIFHATTVAIGVLEGPEHKYSFVNPVTCQILNRTKEELLGKTVKEVFPEVEAQGTIQLYDEVYNTGKPFAINELPIQMDILKNGIARQYYFNLSCEPLRDSEDKIYAILVTAVDVTQQVDVRKRIEASEVKYRSLLNSIDSGFCILEVLFTENEMPYDHRFLEANNAFEKQTGLIDAVGKTMKEMVHEHEQYWFDIFGRIAKTGKSERFENEAKALGIYYEVFAFPIGEPEGNQVGVLFNDITDRKQTEEKIRESEERFRNLVEQAPVAMCVVRGDKFVLEVANEKHLQLINKTKEHIMNLPVFTAMPEVVAQGYRDIAEGVYKTGIPFTANESPLTVIGNGKEETIYVNYVFEPLYDTEHKIDGVFSIATDVTEQVLARKRIEESENRFHELIYSSPSMIAILRGEDLIIELANDAILEQLGKGKHIIGLPFSKAVPEMEEQGFGELLRQVYKTGTPYHAHEMPGTLLYNGIEITNYYNFIYQPQRNINGEIEGVAILANQVTPQALLNKKIEESEQRYHALFMNSPFAFSIMEGKDMKITLANDLMKEFWGKGKDVEGKTLMQVLPELKDQPFPAMLDSVYTTGIPVYANEILAQLNCHGIMEDRYFDIVYEPQLEADETISGVITIAHEVTQQVHARKEIEESEQRLEAAVAAVQGVLWTNNAKGEMEGNQLGWGSLTGQSYEAYQGFGWADALHPDDVQATIEAWNEAVRECKHFVFEHRVKLKNGNWGHFSVKSIPLLNADGLVREWIGVHTDITEQKEAYNKVEAATLSAQEAMKAKQQFLSNMSHEIRTPLNSIIGSANVLLKTELGVEQKQFLQAIKTSGKSLNLLIYDILDLAKVDTGKMTFEKQPFEIRPLISSILHSFDLKIKEKNLKLVKEYDSKIPYTLLGDSLRLNQIFLNIVSNAVKFTHKGRITLSVKLLSETQESVTLEFTVTDSGIGIAANKMDLIFNVFEQAELSTSNSYGGTGLGLAIVKQLIEAQGGSISVKSKLGEGSTFSFILPFGKTNIKLEGEIKILKLDPEINNDFPIKI